MTKNRARKHDVRAHKHSAEISYTAAWWLLRSNLDPGRGPSTWAEQFSRYTGMPVNAAPPPRSSSAHPFPVAPAARARFDAAVMEQVCRAGGFYWAHPFGVAAVHAGPAETVLELDDRTVIDRNKPRDQHPTMADFIIRHLLPSHEGQGATQVDGIPGLRLGSGLGGQRRDLHLVEVDGPGHVVLRAVTGTDWQRILRDVERDVRAAGFKPLWREQAITPQEVVHAEGLPHREATLSRLASIGSSLLYRINLFYAVSVAYTTSSWVSDRWIVEMQAIRAAGHPHNDIVAAFTDPVWGLPLVLDEKSCTCATQPTPWETLCDFSFHDPSTGGELELRFRCRQRTPDDACADYADAAADPAWLDKVLPTWPTFEHC